MNVECLKWDEELRGFACRFTKGGVATYFAIYRNAYGKQQRYKIDRADFISAKVARERALQVLGDASRGQDPAADQKTVRKAKREAETIREALDVYFHSEAHLSRKAASAIEAQLRRDIVGEGKRVVDHFTLGEIRLHELSSDDIRHFRDTKAANASVAANRSLSYLSAFLSWCVEDGRVPSNAAMGVKKAAKEKPRDRYLSNAEIPAFWNACEGVGEPYGELFRFLLLTGQRLSEATGITWDEIDLVEKIWRIPARRTKTNVETIIPLSRQAMSILEARPRFSAGPHIFSSDGRFPILNHSRARAQLAKAFTKEIETASECKVEPFTPHDLRRTARTGFAQLGVDRDVAEQILNHSPGGNRIAQTYDRHHRIPEMRRALQRWADRIDTLTRPHSENVVSIKAVST